MGRRVRFEIELPEEIFGALREEEIQEKAREALVMDLLREHRISQGKAAEILGVNRHELFGLMTTYRIPSIDLTQEELNEELRKPFLNS